MQITYDAERDCHVFIGDGVDPATSVGYVGLRDPDGEVWVRAYDHGTWGEITFAFNCSDARFCTFDWGNDEDASVALAFCILRHATGSAELAGEFFDDFADLVVKHLPEMGFHLSRQSVRSWLENAVRENGEGVLILPAEKAGVP